MKKLRHYFPAMLALAVFAVSAQAADEPKVTGDDKPPAKIHLPPFEPAQVAKWDQVKAKEVPWDLAMVKVPEAWAKNPAARGAGIRIAILDTGCQTDHPGLEGKVVISYNAIDKSRNVKDVVGHGTWCTGAVHAVVPDAELVVIKVLDDSGSGSVDDIAHGIDYATNIAKVDVISMSLGGPTADPYMQPAIKRAVAAGVVVIAAAGNEGPGENTEGYPGHYPESVSVGACDKDAKLASFSSRGSNVFTVDPGVNVNGLLPGDRTGQMSGTSMATPKAAGKCASFLASNKVPKDGNRRDVFRRAVIAVSPFPARNDARGYGLYTLDKITGTAVVPSPGPNPQPTPGVTVTITLDSLTPEARTALVAAGVSELTLKLNTQGKATPTAEQVPVQSVPVPGVWTTPGVQPWFPPLPESVPQTMPSKCPGGVCPAPQVEQWQPFGGRFRVFR